MRRWHLAQLRAIEKRHAELAEELYEANREDPAYKRIGDDELREATSKLARTLLAQGDA